MLIVQPWQQSNGSLSYPERTSGNGTGKWVQNTTDQVMLSTETLDEIAKGTFNSHFFKNQIFVLGTQVGY